MPRWRPPVLPTAIVAALLANYWVLEDLLADRTNFDGSWISDLSTRSESSGGIFVVIGIAAGVALAAYALALLWTLGQRDALVRRGLQALLLSAGAVIVAAAAPLSCAEGLEASCDLQNDPLDVIHSTATGVEIAATILAFGLIGWGLRRTALRRFGNATLLLGALWLALTIVTGVSYLSHGVDELKGAFQRLDQVVFAAWLLVLAAAARAQDAYGGSE